MVKKRSAANTAVSEAAVKPERASTRSNGRISTRNSAKSSPDPKALEENVPSHDKGMTGLEEPLGEAKLTASANGHSDHGSTNGVVNGDDNIDKDPLEEDLMEVPNFTAVRIPLKPGPADVKTPPLGTTLPPPSQAPPLSLSQAPSEKTQDSNEASADNQAKTRKSGRIREKERKKLEEEERRESCSRPGTPEDDDPGGGGNPSGVPNGISPRKLHKKFGKWGGLEGGPSSSVSPDIPDEIMGSGSDQSSKDQLEQKLRAATAAAAAASAAVAAAEKNEELTGRNGAAKPIKVKSRWIQGGSGGGGGGSDGSPLGRLGPRVDLEMMSPDVVLSAVGQGGKRGRPKRRFTVDEDGNVRARSCSPTDSTHSAGSGSSVRSSGNQISVQEMRAKKKAEAEAVAKEVEAINQLEETKKEIQQRLSSFDHITENKFVCERRVNKKNIGMECDCSLSKDEIRRSVKGCGEDCLNKLLMIECDKACTLKNLCGNRRFQNVENAPTEVFKTHWKGIGLRATAEIPIDTFVMEYVGEVLDMPRFRKRAKKYSEDDAQHFYFMALSSELFIDASHKGSVSRFINHSCDPNAETQKWTVNGEIRVGFFAKKKISKGDEITFDYKFERYGQEAQKCYCGASNCRGWLGGSPDKKRQQQQQQASQVPATEKRTADASGGGSDGDDDFWSSSSEDEDEDEDVDEGTAGLNGAMPDDGARPDDGDWTPPPPTTSRAPSSAAVATTHSAATTPNKTQPVVPPGHTITIRAGKAVIVPIDSPKKSKERHLAARKDPALKARKKQRKSPRKVKNFEDDYDEDIERFKTTGIRTKHHTVELCRLMFRTNDLANRLTLANLLLGAEKTCRRLFLDYNGLKIMHSWMSELGFEPLGHLDLKLILEDVLAVLAIPHKTMLVDSKVLDTIAKWSTQEMPPETSSRASPVSDTKVSGVEQIVVNNKIEQLESEKEAVSSWNETSKVLDESKCEAKVDTEVNTSNINELIEEIKSEQLTPPEVSPVPTPPSLPTNHVPSDEQQPRVEDEAKPAAMAEDADKAEIAATISSQQVEPSKACPENEESAPLDVLPIAKAEIPVQKAESSSPQPMDPSDQTSSEIAEKVRLIQQKALLLLESWKNLAEVFKIPRKVLRAEHEREAEEAEAKQKASDNWKQAERRSSTSSSTGGVPTVSSGSGSSLAADIQRLVALGQKGMSALNSGSQGPSNASLAQENRKRSYERSRETSSSFHHRPQATQGTPKAPRFSGFDDDTGLIRRPDLDRNVLRHLFKKKCEREEREKAARAQLQAMHENKCYYLKMDPAVTPMFPQVPAYYYDPTVGTWYQMPDLGTPQVEVTWGYAGMACLPPHAYREDDPELPRPENIYPPGVVKVSFLYGQPMSIDPEYCQAQQERKRRRGGAGGSSTSGGGPPHPPLPSQEQPPPPPTEDIPLPKTPSKASSTSVIEELNRQLNLPQFYVDPDCRCCLIPIPLGIPGPEFIPPEASKSPSDSTSQWKPLEVVTEASAADPSTTDPPSPSKIPMPPSPSKIPVPPVPQPPPLPDSTPDIVCLDETSQSPFKVGGERGVRGVEAPPPPLPEDEPPRNQQDHQSKDASSHVSGPVLLESVTPGSGGALSGGDTRVGGEVGVNRQAVLRLPSRWRIARDPCGRAYYYNVETNECQWDPPPEATEGATSEDQLEEDEVTEADITIVEMEVEASDGEGGDCEVGEDESEATSGGGNGDESDDDDEDDEDEDEVLDSRVRTGQYPSAHDKCSDLSAQERHLLQLRKSTKSRSKEERKYQVKLKNERNREKREYERKRRKERHGQHRSSGLVAEKLIPKRTDKTDLMSFDEIRERLANRDAIREGQAAEEFAEEERDRQQLEERLAHQEHAHQQLAARAASASTASTSASTSASSSRRKQQQQQQESHLREAEKLAATAAAAGAGSTAEGGSAEAGHSGSGAGGASASVTAVAAADTSSEVAKKINDRFKKEVSKVIVKVLDPFRKEGQIKSTEDFKHLAKKLTNYILTKEMKHCARMEDLKCSESVKKKAAGYVKKYMTKFTEGYKRSPPQPGSRN